MAAQGVGDPAETLEVADDDARQILAPLDNQHVENIRKFLEKRDQRDRQAGTVYDQLGVSRRTIDDLFEPGSAFTIAGIQSPISRNPDRLIHQANLALERLSSPDLVLRSPKVTGIKVDLKTLVEDLELEVEKLRASNTGLHEARRAVQQSRKERNAALEEQYHTFLWASRTLEGYYRLADEEKLAQEIRPSTRRPGRRAIEVEGEESGESPDSSTSDDVASEQASGETAGSGQSEASES